MLAQGVEKMLSHRGDIPEAENISKLLLQCNRFKQLLNGLLAEARQGSGTAILTGVLVSVGTSMALEWVKGEGIWSGKGNVVQRWDKRTSSFAEHSFLSAPPPFGD